MKKFISIPLNPPVGDLKVLIMQCLAPRSQDEVGASAAQDVPIALASGGDALSLSKCAGASLKISDTLN